MTIKTPVKATFTGSDVTGLAEFQSADFIGVVDGGTGAVTFSAGILKADGTNAFTTVTAPSGDIVGTSDTQTLTNKTINSASNTITITESNISDLQSYILADSTNTLTNKTISGSSNTLTNIGNSSLTNSGITVVDDSSTSATISLGETLKISGTSNEIETAISGDTITIGLPSNVTIGNNLTVTGDLTVNGTTTTVNSTTIEITNSFTFEGSTANDFETTLGVIDPTADRTINLPNVSGTLPVLAVASTTQITATPEELNYSDGVTSNIQTQIDSKASQAFAIAQAVALG